MDSTLTSRALHLILGGLLGGFLLASAAACNAIPINVPDPSAAERKDSAVFHPALPDAGGSVLRDAAYGEAPEGAGPDASDAAGALGADASSARDAGLRDGASETGLPDSGLTDLGLGLGEQRIAPLTDAETPRPDH